MPVIRVRCVMCEMKPNLYDRYDEYRSSVFMQSWRFPSVYIHGPCRATLRMKCERAGIDTSNILIRELITADTDTWRFVDLNPDGSL